MVDALRPAYDVAVRQSGNMVDNMVRAQTKLTVAQLKKEPGLAEKIRAGLAVHRAARIGAEHHLPGADGHVLADGMRTRDHLPRSALIRQQIMDEVARTFRQRQAAGL